MPALQVRDFPADLYGELKERAKRESRSLSQQTIVAVREHLAASQSQAAGPFARIEDEKQRRERREALFAEMDQRPKVVLPPSFPRPVDIIREIRDAR
jgi:hypothetical protein